MSFAPSTTNYYSLTNSYAGSNNSLGTYPSDGDTLLSAATGSNGNVTAIKNWSFHPSGQNQYHICAPSTSSSSLLCIDILNPGAPANASVSNRNTPHLTTPQDVQGQLWSLTPYNDNITSIKLTNEYSGPTLALDTYANSLQAFMEGEDHSGQHWILTKGEQCNGGQACSGNVPGASAANVTVSQSQSHSTTGGPAATATPTNNVQKADGTSWRRDGGRTVGVLAGALLLWALIS